MVKQTRKADIGISYSNCKTKEKEALSGVCKTKSISAVHRPCTLVDKVIFPGVQVISNTAIHMYWYWTIKYMDDRCWEPGFSVLEWEFTEKQEKEVRIIYVVMDLNWRYQYELILKVRWIQLVTCRNNYRYVYIHGLLLAHVLPCFFHREGPEATTH